MNHGKIIKKIEIPDPRPNKLPIYVPEWPKKEPAKKSVPIGVPEKI
jgi:hypothetical protein